MENIEQFLNQFAVFTQEELSKVYSKFAIKEVPAKHVLVDFNQKTDKLYFLVKGCIRKYCFKDGNPVTLLIASENEFAVEYVSFMSGERSENILETIEACHLLVIKKSDLEKLYLEVPSMNIVMRKVLEQVIYKTHLLLNDFIKLKPEERYLQLLELNPTLFNRVPQHIMASYLGISATSLSRIRKRIFTKST